MKAHQNKFSDGSYLKDELYNLIKTDDSFFDFLQEGSLDGIWYWDLTQPEYEWMSPKFWTTFGYNPLEKTHCPEEWQEIIFDEDLQKAEINLAKHLENPHHPYDQLVRYRHKLGHTVWIRCRGMAIRDETTGEAIRLLGAHTNLTYQMQALSMNEALQYQLQALQMQVETLSMRIEMKDKKIHELENMIQKSNETEMQTK